MSIESFRDPTPEEKRMRPWEWAIVVVILLFFAWVAVGLTGCKKKDAVRALTLEDTLNISVPRNNSCVSVSNHDGFIVAYWDSGEWKIEKQICVEVRDK